MIKSLSKAFAALAILLLIPMGSLQAQARTVQSPNHVETETNHTNELFGTLQNDQFLEDRIATPYHESWLEGETDRETDTSKQTNVSGTLQVDNQNVANAWLYIVQNEDEAHPYKVRVKDGGFQAYLPDGSYHIYSYFDNGQQKRVALNYSFQVNNGMSSQNPLRIQLKADNVQGLVQLQQSNRSVEGNIQIVTVGVNQVNWYQTDVVNGKFDLYLPDAVYKVDGVYIKSEKKFVEVQNETFTVQNGKITFIQGQPATNGQQLVISIPAENVKGTVTGADNKRVKSGSLNLHSNGVGQQNYNTTITNGAFGLYLPDGSYHIDGYYDAQIQKHITLGSDFTVSNGTLTTGTLDIHVPVSNVIGTLYFQKDGTAVQQGTLQIHTTDRSKFYTVYVENGLFDLYLPDGQYSVEQYWDASTSNNASILPFSFTVSNGKVDRDVHLLVPKPNVSGGIQLSDGTKVTNARLNLHSIPSDATASGTGQSQFYSTSITNGSFSLYLPDGDYALDGYWDFASQSLTPLNVTFHVQGMDVSNIRIDNQASNQLFITIHKKNVFGTLKLSDGTNLDQVLLNLHTTDGSNQWYQTSVVNGSFSLYLPGGTYQVENYWDGTHTISFEYSFTVSGDQNNIAIVVPKPNVSGTVTNITGSNVMDGWLQVMQYTSDGDGMQPLNPPVLKNINIANGSFQVNLPDGTYVIVGYWDSQQQKDVNALIRFAIKSGVCSVPILVIQEQAANLSGTMHYDDGSPFNNVTLLFSTPDVPNYAYNTDVTNGSFQIYLPNGTYSVFGYQDDGTNTFHSLQGLSVTVVNGVASPLDITIQKPNVFGVVQYQSNNETAKPQHGTIHFQMIDPTTGNATGGEYQTDIITDGSFQLNLPTGTYQITGFYDGDTQVYHTLDMTITVPNDLYSQSNPFVVTIMN